MQAVMYGPRNHGFYGLRGGPQHGLVGGHHFPIGLLVGIADRQRGVTTPFRAGAKKQQQYAGDRALEATLSATHVPFHLLAVLMPRTTIDAATHGYGVPQSYPHPISCASADCYFFVTAINITRISAAGSPAEPAGK